jgi:hypothetical protein
MIGRTPGDGILSNGMASSAVQQTIESRAGRGTKLPEAQRSKYSSALSDPLRDVTIHTDDTANLLARSVNAEAFALRTTPTSRDVFFAKGTYEPGTHAGSLLLGEELAHLNQQKKAAMTPNLKISDPSSSLEREAAGFAQAHAGKD